MNTVKAEVFVPHEICEECRKMRIKEHLWYNNFHEEVYQRTCEYEEICRNVIELWKRFERVNNNE